MSEKGGPQRGDPNLDDVAAPRSAGGFGGGGAPRCRPLGRRLLGYERVLGVSRHIATLDLETALARILREVLALTGAHRGAVLLREEDGALDVRATQGLEEVELITSAGFAFSRSVVEQALETREVVVIENVPRSSASARSSIVALELVARPDGRHPAGAARRRVRVRGIGRRVCRPARRRLAGARVGALGGGKQRLLTIVIFDSHHP